MRAMRKRQAKIEPIIRDRRLSFKNWTDFKKKYEYFADIVAVTKQNKFLMAHGNGGM